ncbi:hypothetical protein U1Q18_008497, partial [Sarracenia purpurea var. burkii]
VGSGEEREEAKRFGIYAMSIGSDGRRNKEEKDGGRIEWRGSGNSGAVVRGGRVQWGRG